MSKYRIDASFKLMGAFWRYGQKDQRFTGILSSRNGLVEVKTAPSYLDIDQTNYRATLPNFSDVATLQNVESICGFTTDNDCTLLNVVALDGGGLTNFSSRQKISRERFRAMRTVMGLHVESSEAKSIDGAAYYFTKIHHLMPIPWKSKMTTRTTTYTTSHRLTTIFAFSSKAIDATVDCEIFAGSGMKVRKGVKIVSVPRIKIVSKTPQSVDWYTSIAFRLENFFSLFMGTSVTLKEVQLFKGKNEGWVVQKIKRKNEKNEPANPDSLHVPRNC